jgi:predicted GNAT family acetyltransferase
MAQKILKCKIKREKGYLYYIDKKGNVSMAKMARGKQKGGSPKVVVKAGIKRKKGYLYFIDKQGDVAMAKMARGGRKKKR